ncbi:TetR/AcrR family transcriptional regulator [Alicyclobacillus fastidiosus]|uniref:TetR/AcrR family transcriptional regulator n=1 Tax=Alicyclobacillus fastidiosus TaxID=392011 RepID=A0ABV5A8Q8_9BACL|nr:TetR/AcrR family transcriptional regulator [Alicyclobacillus fastidiosus]WEH10635.1 TetR/AcrR family transcriptional regulator [Alicyclobacillus fastidiosus]
MEHRRQQRLDKIRNLMKEDILDAAFQLILEKGISAVSIVEIAKRVDTSRVTIYKYFNSIDEIIFHIQTKVLSELNVYRDFETLTGQTGAEKLLSLLQRFVGMFQTHHEQIRFTAMFDHAYHGAYPSDMLHDMYRDFIRNMRLPLERLIAIGMEDGSLSKEVDPNILALTLEHSTLGLMQHLATRQNVFTNDSMEEDLLILNQFIDTFMKSLTTSY